MHRIDISNLFIIFNPDPVIRVLAFRLNPALDEIAGSGLVQ